MSLLYFIFSVAKAKTEIVPEKEISDDDDSLVILFFNIFKIFFKIIFGVAYTCRCHSSALSVIFKSGCVYYWQFCVDYCCV